MKTRFARFIAKVDKGKNDATACWLWTGAKGGSGYGQFWNGRRRIPAHWFLVVDSMPDGKEACHKCDNKLCVRPDHIFIGSRSDNERDKVSKGRHNPEASRRNCLLMLKTRKLHRGHNNHQSKLTESEAIQAKNCSRKYGAATALAKKFGVSVTVICGIRDGERWTHLK